MLVLLSPAKTLDYSETNVAAVDKPYFYKDSKVLIDMLKQLSHNDLMKLMSINEKLASLNYTRYQNFSTRYTDKNSKASILAFKGDVYLGLEAETLTQNELAYAQKHVRILSGLYGILAPLDKMQPYRLEMGTKLKHPNGKNLYDYWGDKITQYVNRYMKKNDLSYIVNLASKEYFSALNKKLLKQPIIDVNFKEYRDGQLKFLSFFAKKARGTMTRYIVQNQISSIEGLMAFNEDNYRFEASLSTETALTFVR